MAVEGSQSLVPGMPVSHWSVNVPDVSGALGEPAPWVKSPNPLSKLSHQTACRSPTQKLYTAAGSPPCVWIT